VTVAFPAQMPFPLAARQMFEIQRVDYVAPDAGGRLNSIAAGFPLWRGEWTLGTLSLSMSDAVEAFVAGQRGSARHFYGFDFRRRAPRSAFQGTPFAPAASSWSQAVDGAGIVRLTLNGLLPGQVLTRADHIGFEWSTWKRALVRTIESVVANDSGVAVVAIEPAVPTLVPGAAIAVLKNPTCLMKLVPGETKLGAVGRKGTIEGGSIVAVQDLVA